MKGLKIHFNNYSSRPYRAAAKVVVALLASIACSVWMSSRYKTLLCEENKFADLEDTTVDFTWCDDDSLLELHKNPASQSCWLVRRNSAKQRQVDLSRGMASALSLIPKLNGCSSLDGNWVVWSDCVYTYGVCTHNSRCFKVQSVARDPFDIYWDCRDNSWLEFAVANEKHSTLSFVRRRVDDPETCTPIELSRSSPLRRSFGYNRPSRVNQSGFAIATGIRAGDIRNGISFTMFDAAAGWNVKREWSLHVPIAGFDEADFAVSPSGHEIAWLLLRSQCSLACRMVAHHILGPPMHCRYELVITSIDGTNLRQVGGWSSRSADYISGNLRWRANNRQVGFAYRGSVWVCATT